MKSLPSLLIVRRDKLGDVLLALPTVAYLRAHLPPETQVHFWVRESWWDLLQGWAEKTGVQLVASDRIAKKRYSAALVLYATAREFRRTVAPHAAFSFGLFSKPWSFFRLEAGLRQHRTGDRSEMESNLELAQAFWEECFEQPAPAAEPSAVILPFCEDAAARVTLRLRHLGVGPGYTVLHPGSGGSARNLPAERYVQLVQKLRREDAPWVLTQGPDDTVMVRILSEGTGLPVLSGLSLLELAELFRGASRVIAPGTGPLHLAHLVGARTYGLFAPIPSQHPQRWRPMGGQVPSVALVPQVPCPASRKCLGDRCAYFDCLARADWETWIEKGELDALA